MMVEPSLSFISIPSTPYIEVEEVLTITSKILKIAPITLMFDSLQMQLSGVMKGIGKPFSGVYISIFSCIFMQIGIVYPILNYTEWGVVAKWYTLALINFLN